MQWRVIPTQEMDLFRAPALLENDTGVILLDGGFTQSSGRAQVEAIRAAGKPLRLVLVTCHDPDYYFGLSAVRAAFPDVSVLAPRLVADRIAATATQKYLHWRGQLGEEAPPDRDKVVIPAPLDEAFIDLGPERIEIVAAEPPGAVHLWLADVRAILGGVQISSGNHIWMADTPAIADRQPWLASIEAMMKLDPLHVLPGHIVPGAPMGIAAICFTRDYIRAFDQEQARAKNGDALVAAMLARYPDLAMPFILELGARVCMGEQSWP